MLRWRGDVLSEKSMVNQRHAKSEELDAPSRAKMPAPSIAMPLDIMLFPARLHGQEQYQEGRLTPRNVDCHHNPRQPKGQRGRCLVAWASPHLTRGCKRSEEFRAESGSEPDARIARTVFSRFSQHESTYAIGEIRTRQLGSPMAWDSVFWEPVRVSRLVVTLHTAHAKARFVSWQLTAVL